MTASEHIRLYEQPPLREVAGETIRPGGLGLTDRALAFCVLPPGARVLDVGCGPAASVEHLRTHCGFAAFGLDPSALPLQAGRQRNGSLPLVQGQGEHLPFGEVLFDALFAECSLSLMDYSARALGECWRLLRGDGYLIVSDLYARNADGAAALANLPIASCLRGALPQSDVFQRLQTAGFTVCLWEDHTSALKSFAAQLIWQHGSMGQFWCRAASPSSAADIQAAVTLVKPGYFLLVARKMAG